MVGVTGSNPVASTTLRRRSLPAASPAHTVNPRFTAVLAVVALAAVLLLFTRVQQLQDRLERVAGPATGPAVSAPSAPAAQVEVAHNMNRIQNYVHKLWWAGNSGHLELAKFYRHEIKEEMEEVANAGIMDKTIPVSQHMKVYGIRAIDVLKEQLAADSLKDFPMRYNALIEACNACHASCAHPELRMQVPLTNRYPEQVFTP